MFTTLPLAPSLRFAGRGIKGGGFKQEFSNEDMLIAKVFERN